MLPAGKRGPGSLLGRQGGVAAAPRRVPHGHSEVQYCAQKADGQEAVGGSPDAKLQTTRLIHCFLPEDEV